MITTACFQQAMHQMILSPDHHFTILVVSAEHRLHHTGSQLLISLQENSASQELHTRVQLTNSTVSTTYGATYNSIHNQSSRAAQSSCHCPHLSTETVAILQWDKLLPSHFQQDILVTSVFYTQGATRNTISASNSRMYIEKWVFNHLTFLKNIPRVKQTSFMTSTTCLNTHHRWQQSSTSWPLKDDWKFIPHMDPLRIMGSSSEIHEVSSTTNIECSDCHL